MDQENSGPTAERLEELLEELRAELQAVNRRIDALLSGQRLEEDSSLPLNIHPSIFKGRRPISVSFPDGRTVMTKTWKQVASAILTDCNSDPVMHTRLLSISGKVFGRDRVLLGDKEGMDVPVKIDEGIYLETKFDTESLLYVLKDRILKPVGYDCGGISIQCRDPEQTMSDQRQSGGPSMTGQSM